MTHSAGAGLCSIDSELADAAISDSSGWKILAAMLLSELVIEVESATFVEQRYVVQERLKKRHGQRTSNVLTC